MMKDLKIYPLKEQREQKLKELQNNLNILVSNKEMLERQINTTLFEIRILQEIEQLEDAINGKISITMTPQQD